MKQVHLQPAYVLHRRAYCETSFLVELFTPEHGRLTVVAKGVRKKGSSAPGLLQAFTPLLVSWYGKTELMTLTHVEAQRTQASLQGECLFAGLYLNELIMYLVQKWDAHPSLFALYAEALNGLRMETLQQKVLRSFEKNLLNELGYGILTKADGLSELRFSPDKHYRFTSEHGFMVVEEGANDQVNIFSGKSLIAIAKENWEIESSLQDAKRLTRFVLTPLLGSRTIHSRQLFIRPQEET